MPSDTMIPSDTNDPLGVDGQEVVEKTVVEQRAETVGLLVFGNQRNTAGSGMIGDDALRPRKRIASDRRLRHR